MRRLILIACLATPSAAIAHDTWVQTNTNLIRVGDSVHVDLMLGNHGNGHRDFKMAGKPSLEGGSLEVIGPDGVRHDLKGVAVDTGFTPQEGYWTARFDVARAGLHVVAQADDRVMSYAPERSVKGAKAFFVGTTSLDRPPTDNPGFDRPVGHALEIVPVTNPVTPMGPGVPIQVRLLYEGKPLEGERVCFMPRGAVARAGVDDRYERTTDAEGLATFEPTEATYYLISAHKLEPTRGGELGGKPYESTKYGATMTVFVPRVCPCCGE